MTPVTAILCGEKLAEWFPPECRQILEKAAPFVFGLFFLLIMSFNIFAFFKRRKIQQIGEERAARTLQNQEESLRLLRELLTVAKAHTLFKTDAKADAKPDAPAAAKPGQEL
jgi:hypothetical protein